MRAALPKAVTTCLLALTLAMPRAGAVETVLRVVPHDELTILDPVFSSSNGTVTHGYMVYDTLFALDHELKPQPQMLESFSRSEDGLAWSFTLRPGLKWHDGTPVVAADAVASIRRWARRNVGGRAMMGHAVALDAKDERSFTLTLKSPFALVPEVLADPIIPAFMMREKDARTEPTQQVTEIVGSGPFVFNRDAFLPGSRIVYRRNPDYVPRPEPADNLAGGKLAKVDRVEFVYLPDANTASAALTAKEFDIYVEPPSDLFPLLRANPGIRIDQLNQSQGVLRPNSLVPPFNNPVMRQALLHALDQGDHLAAMVGDPSQAQRCYSPFPCPSEAGTLFGPDRWKPDPDKAKALLRQAGYKGETIVILAGVDLLTNYGNALVTAQELRRIGMTVDVQTMDWSNVTTRRNVRAAPTENRGGWNIFFTSWPVEGLINPALHAPLATNCDATNYFGWPCDEKLEALRESFLVPHAPDDLRTRYAMLADEYLRAVPYVPTGQFTKSVAYRTDVQGLLKASWFVLWGASKNAQ